MMVNTLSFSFHTETEFLNVINQYQLNVKQPMFIQVCIDRADKAAIVRIQKMIRKYLPKATLFGNASNDRFLNNKSSQEDRMEVSILTFENTEVKSLFVDMDEFDNPVELGNWLNSKLHKINPKLSFVYSAGNESTIDDMLSEVYHKNPEMHLAGGWMDSSSYIFNGERISNNAIAVVMLKNDQLSIHSATSDYVWQDIGREFTVTKAEGTIVAEIEHAIPKELLMDYLGEGFVSKIPQSSMEFPFITSITGQQKPLFITEILPDGAVRLSNAVKEGTRLTFAFTDIERTMETSLKHMKQLATVPAEVIFMYRSPSRKQLLPSFSEKENEWVQKIAPVVHCVYDGATNGSSHSRLLKNATTWVTISENNAISKQPELIFQTDGTREMNLRKTLSHLIRKTQLELQALNNRTYYDYDTGLPNRTKFSEELAFWIEKSKKTKHQFAVLLIDIDRFKNINDSFGHQAGDVVLKKLAGRMGHILPEDALLGRFEGDKFSLLLNEGEIDSVFAIANKILTSIYQVITYKELDFFVTASIGVSMYPEDGCNGQTLLKNADIAMNRSKSKGGNVTTFYCHDMNLQAMNRLKLESGLRKAIDQNEFYLEYQPLIDLEKGKVFGSEALIRWQHPELGLIAPLDFIPIAEETGMIIEIGNWVLREACRQNKIWQEMGLGDLSISVNVSARQFQELNFTDMVKQALVEADLAPQYLTLELTESVMLENIDYSTTIIRELQQLGVKVSIDDFGTGYSSLNYLKNLPINTLKIDRSFINNLQLHTSDIAIVKAIITMGLGLSVQIVAEGVETEEQLHLLKELHCDFAQGFYFAKPQPADKFHSSLDHIKMI